MNLNPELNVNDKVVLVHMNGESFSPGTKGIVKSVVDDPFEPGHKIYEIKWEDGSSLSLLSATDYWVLNDDFETRLTEDTNYQKSLWLMENVDIFKYFDTKTILNFLLKLRDSAVVNMFQAAPFIYMGKERLAHEFYYNKPENADEFEEVLDMADEVQSIMIEGVLRIIDDSGQSYDDSTINRLIKRYADKMVQLYIKLH